MDNSENITISNYPSINRHNGSFLISSERTFPSRLCSSDKTNTPLPNFSSTFTNSSPNSPFTLNYTSPYTRSNIEFDRDCNVSSPMKWDYSADLAEIEKKIASVSYSKNLTVDILRHEDSKLTSALVQIDENFNRIVHPQNISQDNPHDKTFTSGATSVTPLSRNSSPLFFPTIKPTCYHNVVEECTSLASERIIPISEVISQKVSTQATEDDLKTIISENESPRLSVQGAKKLPNETDQRNNSYQSSNHPRSSRSIGHQTPRILLGEETRRKQRHQETLSDLSSIVDDRHGHGKSQTSSKRNSKRKSFTNESGCIGFDDQLESLESYTVHNLMALCHTLFNKLKETRLHSETLTVTKSCSCRCPHLMTPESQKETASRKRRNKKIQVTLDKTDDSLDNSTCRDVETVCWTRKRHPGKPREAQSYFVSFEGASQTPPKPKPKMDNVEVSLQTNNNCSSRSANVKWMPLSHYFAAKCHTFLRKSAERQRLISSKYPMHNCDRKKAL